MKTRRVGRVAGGSELPWGGDAVFTCASGLLQQVDRERLVQVLNTNDFRSLF